MPITLTPAPLARVLALLFLILPWAVLADGDASERFEQAKRHYHDGELNAAVIELKNALQIDANHLGSHVLLGSIYAEQGEAAAAEEELVLARSLGADRALVIVPLARAYLLQGKLEEVLSLQPSSELPRELRADLLVEHANALRAAGDIDKGLTAARDARRLAPDSGGPLVAESRLLLSGGRYAEAETLARQATIMEPDAPAAWTTLASTVHAQGRLQEALELYGTALAEAPDYADAHAARLGILIDLGRSREALETASRLREELPPDPRVAYLHGVLLRKNGELAKAREAIADAVTLLQPYAAGDLLVDPPLLLIAGLANYDTGNLERARTLLTTYVEAHPQHLGPLRVLAALHMQTGAPQEVIRLLEPAATGRDTDPRTLSLLAEAYMRTGRHGTATELLRQASAASEGDTRVRTLLAFSLAGLGHQDQAHRELQDVYAEHPSADRAAMALALSHLEQGRSRAAEEVAQRLTEAEPERVNYWVLLGKARARSGDLQGAREAFLEVEARDPRGLAGQLNLARLELAQGMVSAAEVRLDRALEHHPTSSLLMTELAVAAEQRGDLDTAARWLEKAHQADGSALDPLLRAVDVELRREQPTVALELAEEAQLLDRENARVLQALGRAQAALGRPELARAAYREAARLVGYDGSALLRIASLQAAAEGVEDAAWSLEKAVAADPDLTVARVALVELLIALGRLANAEESLAVLRQRSPELPVGDRLAGDLAMARGEPNAARDHYRRVVERSASPRGVALLYQAHRAAGDLDAAVGLLEDWVEQNPDHVALRRLLGEHLLYTGRLAEARNHMRRVLDRFPEDPVTLNNLALVLQELGEPGALAYAREARRLAPESAAVADTLGWLLVQEGEVPEGLSHLRYAQARDATNPEIRYHLAVALERLGRLDEARIELDRALNPSAGDFASREQALVLRDRLLAR